MSSFILIGALVIVEERETSERNPINNNKDIFGLKITSINVNYELNKLIVCYRVKYFYGAFVIFAL